MLRSWRNSVIPSSGTSPAVRLMAFLEKVIICLCASWEWAIVNLLFSENVVRSVKPPYPQIHTIKTFNKRGIRASLRQAGQGSMTELRYAIGPLLGFFLIMGHMPSQKAG
jgi:hypothetical protein